MVVTGASCGAGSLSCHSNCDPLDTTACSLPFPSSFYLVPADNTARGGTGFQVAFTAE